MINRIKRLAIWFRRIAYCRGFGIQSPWAYGFVRYVINQHNPYYAYEGLGRKWRVRTPHVRRKRELLFRLANYAQPERVVLSGLSDDVSAVVDYLKAGCRRIEVCRAEGADEVAQSLAHHEGNVMVVADLLTVADEKDALRLTEALRGGDFLYVDNIAYKPTQSLWRRIQVSPAATVCFDLYYCGIVYCDPERHKQNYIINF